MDGGIAESIVFEHGVLLLGGKVHRDSCRLGSLAHCNNFVCHGPVAQQATTKTP